MAELIVTTPDGNSSRYRIGQFAMLGRHPECDIVLTDPMSSRRHCKIEMAPGGQYYVEDNGSANGTVLNGEFLRTRKPLQNGDVVQIGSTRMALHVEAPAPVAPPKKKIPTNMDPSMSFVSIKEDTGEQVSFDYTINNTGALVTEEEAGSSDLGQLKRVTARLKLMVDLAQALGSSLNTRKVLQTCLEKLFEVFQSAERGFVLLYGPDGQIPSTLDPVNPEDEDVNSKAKAMSVSHVRSAKTGQENNEVAISKTVVNKVKAGRQSVLIRDAAGDSEFSPAMSMARLEIRSVMCVPLIAAEEDLGILYMDTKDAAHLFTKDDLNLLNAVAGQIAMLIRNAKLARKAASEVASRQNLQRFLSPQLVDQVMKGEVTVELGGMMKHGTVFFSDLVGFTRMAAQMRPQDIITLLNRYFRVMQEIIFSLGGSVDKCSGDQIMAFWGVLVDTPRAAAAAGTAAIEMQNAMFIFNEDLAADKDIVKPPEPFGHGIGLNTGDFIAGNIGGDRKVEFTVIGNAVNLAQRLEATAGRGQVFIGEGTYEELKDVAFCIRLPDCPVKNVPQPIKMFSLRGVQAMKDTGEAVLASGNFNFATQDVDKAAMLFSLPCSLITEGQNPIPAIVTRMLFSAHGEGRIKLITQKPLPVGVSVALHWKLDEKPNLPFMNAKVEKTWGTGEGEGTTMINDAGSPNRAMILNVPKIPDDLRAFSIGSMIPSDLKTHDQIIRK